tara:strand:- start:3013 stop:3546 length:534 start_codon:yes stop_codon:yes gene_type:complete
MDRISLTPPELYGNIGYTNSIVERIPISIHLNGGDAGGGGGLKTAHQTGDGYRASLGDVINIDRVTDVFLDSFISYGTTAMASGTETYVLGVKEFDIKTVSNDTSLKNKILIPNTAPNPSAPVTTLHRASKFNYVGTITPKKLKELTITLTDGGSTQLGSAGTAKVWINFILIPREK